MLKEIEIILLSSREEIFMTLHEQIGLMIRRLRKDNNYSQEDLAKLVGYKDRTAIAKIEAGKVDLPLSRIITFADVLNTTPTLLFSGSYNKFSKALNVYPEYFSNQNSYTESSNYYLHFDQHEYSKEELNEISNYAKYIKYRKK